MQAEDRFFSPCSISALSSVRPRSYKISFMSRMRERLSSADIEAGYDL